jgi:ectoine hydroxylase-related dioxygenase (phytanoyl-CoA dioxygenase family)
MTTAQSTIPEEKVQSFHDEGYMILENALDSHLVEIAREECAASIERKEEKMRKQGKTEDGINLLGKRYFIGLPSLFHPRLYELIFNDLTAEICRKTLGPDAFFFWDQYVVKFKDEEGSFAWHQDDGYTLGRPHHPTTTCWIALDDMTEENGTIRVLPYSRAGGKELREHFWSDKQKAQVGYDGDDPGDLVEVPAGSVVVFSSLLLHRSGPNRTDRPRRSLFLSYSKEIIVMKDAEKGMWGRGEPFLKDGYRVDRQVTDYLQYT